MTGRSSTPETSVLEPRGRGVLDAPHEAGHDSGVLGPGHKVAIPRRDAPELYMNIALEKQRAQGKPGARSTRSPCALVVSTRSSPRLRLQSPGFPRAMVLTVSFVLSPATNSFLSPSLSGLSATSPGWAGFASAQLDISNGCQDHTTSPFAATSAKRVDLPCAAGRSFGRGVEAPFVYAPVDRSRETRPAITSCAPTLPRPPHPTARFVTIASRPSFG